MSTQQHVRLRREEASEYLKSVHGIVRKISTLSKYASVGGGPKFEYVGRVPTYRPAELDAWARSLLSGPCSKAAERPDRTVQSSARRPTNGSNDIQEAARK
jgi:hypothetical protein